MAVNSYTTLLTAIQDELDRDDIAAPASNWISFMEARLYRVLRIRFMESSLSVTIASGVAALPSDFLELKLAYLNTNPTTPLQIRNADWIHARYNTRSSSGVPHFVAQDDDNLIFGPYPDSTYEVAGTYYAKPTALSLSNESNWLTTNAPEVLLYGCLPYSAPFVGHDDRIKLWEAMYQDALGRLIADNKRQRFPAEMPLRQICG